MNLLQMPAVRPKLNPTAPEFEPRSNDEEEEDFNNQVCSEGMLARVCH